MYLELSQVAAGAIVIGILLDCTIDLPRSKSSSANPNYLGGIGALKGLTCIRPVFEDQARFRALSAYTSSISPGPSGAE